MARHERGSHAAQSQGPVMPARYEELSRRECAGLRRAISRASASASVKIGARVVKGSPYFSATATRS